MDLVIFCPVGTNAVHRFELNSERCRHCGVARQATVDKPRFAPLPILEPAEDWPVRSLLYGRGGKS